MTPGKIHKLLAAGLLFAFAFSACKDDDTTPAEPVTSVEIRLTADAPALEGIPVALYKNELDWALEQNPVQVANTNAGGYAWFTYLTDTAYYVNAAKGELSNWETNYKIVGIHKGKPQGATLRLGNYLSHQISDPQGKIWRLNGFKINGADKTGDTAYNCVTDNLWVFYKGDRSGRFELRENVEKCAADAQEIVSGSWQISEDGSKIFLPEGDEVITYLLLHLTRNSLQIRKQIGTEVYDYTLIHP